MDEVDLNIDEAELKSIKDRINNAYESEHLNNKKLLKMMLALIDEVHLVESYLGKSEITYLPSDIHNGYLELINDSNMIVAMRLGEDFYYVSLLNNYSFEKYYFDDLEKLILAISTNDYSGALTVEAL